MGKKLFILLVVGLLGTSLFAQQRTEVLPSGKLYAKYQSDYIERMRQTSPQTLLFWNWFADNGYIVKKVEPSIAAQYPLLYFLDKDTKERGEAEVAYTEGFFNIMAYDFEIHPDKFTVYRIGETGYLVNILSTKKLTKKFNYYLSHE